MSQNPRGVLPKPPGTWPLPLNPHETPAVFRVGRKILDRMVSAYPSAISAGRPEVSNEEWLNMRKLLVQYPSIVVKLSSESRGFRKLVWLWGSGAVSIARATSGGDLPFPNICEDDNLEKVFNKYYDSALPVYVPTQQRTPQRVSRPPAQPDDRVAKPDSPVEEAYLNNALTNIHSSLRQAMQRTSGPPKATTPIDSEDELSDLSEPLQPKIVDVVEAAQLLGSLDCSAPPLPPRDEDTSRAVHKDEAGEGLAVAVAEPAPVERESGGQRANVMIAAAVVCEPNPNGGGGAAAGSGGGVAAGSGSGASWEASAPRNSSYFSELMHQVQSGWRSKHKEQIQKDVVRSECPDPKYQEQLTLVLHCYALRNEKVGYCQGMNFFGARALLNGFTMEETFWFLAAIVEDVCAEKFTVKLLGVLVDCEVMARLLARYQPQLHQHMQRIEASAQPFLSGMFITLFCNQFPNRCVDALWDYMFLVGPRPAMFAVVLDFFHDAKELLLSATSADSFNQFMVMQLESWKHEQNADAEAIISRSFVWLVQLAQEPGLLEGITVDAEGFVQKQQEALDKEVAAKEVSTLAAVLRSLKQCSTLLGHRALTAATAPQRAKLLEGCQRLLALFTQQRPELMQRHARIHSTEQRHSMPPLHPRLGLSTEEQVLKQVSVAFHELLQACRADTSGLTSALPSAGVANSKSVFEDVKAMSSAARALASTGVPYSKLRYQLGEAFWETALGHIGLLEKKGLLQVALTNANGEPKQKVVLTAFSSNEEFEQAARQQAEALRKVLDGSITVVLLAKMFSMELDYVSKRYFDADTRLDARSNLNDLLTVVSSHLTNMLAGRGEAFIEAYFQGLQPWRSGRRRLLLLPSEEADDSGKQPQQPQQSQQPAPEMSKGRKQALSLVVLTRCLNLSQQLDAQIQLLPPPLRNPYAAKLVKLFTTGILKAHHRIALARAVDACLKNLENVKPWVAAVKSGQRFTRDQLLPVFNRTLWIQQQVAALADPKWRSLLLKQAKQYEQDLRNALIQAM